MPDIRIGISGWRYPPWRGGTFYPRGLPQRDELAYAARAVRTIEINGSFYSLQTPASYAAWRDATPDDFVFAVKGPRYITHLKRLRNIRVPLANFFASGVLRLGEKFGPLLWQLPPNLPFDPARLAAFFDLLPRSTDAAAALARHHDHHLRHRAWLRTDASRPLRHALEVRHPSFAHPEFVALLRAHHIALVVADTAGKWPFLEDVTSDFVYVRLHGDEELYASGYTDAALTRWAAKIKAWTHSRTPAHARLAGARPRAAAPADVFVYFDNDVKVRAPFDAMTLAHKLHLGPAPGTPPDPATIAEVPRPIRADARWRFTTTAANAITKSPVRRAARARAN
ncbi:DUF72 domain-containing protein [Horticoccus luteus]|uniref:DUF72 domain-containing protein n=1 Tax=Horticoccus luteus TaxID=2862869 RepID=A0A8F9XMD7_9BACT|nr:DUF72 domain-containing protein [Horticoccus luteus]QYM80141.1 DUF72 domain-containing protein [Horticoccus luteus]